MLRWCNAPKRAHHLYFQSNRILFIGITLFFLIGFSTGSCLPCQENNERIKPFVRMSTRHCHLRLPPTHKKNQPTAFTPFQCYLIVVFHPSPLPPPVLRAHLIVAARPRQQAFFFVVFVFGQDELKIPLSWDEQRESD